jgi:predicted TIM-barrel fold metal-dependent hydrolase
VIIDFHTHIFPLHIPEKRDEYLKCDPCFKELYANPKAKLASAEDLINSMDEDGIDVSVALNIGWSDHDLCVETNDYIMEAVAKYPKRIIGFCTIQPQAGEKALIELERCAKGGLRGIGELRTDTQGYDLGNKEIMEPVAEVAQKYDMIVLTHSSEPVGHIYDGKGNISPRMLYRFISNFPDLKIVCAHWGGGLSFYMLMPEVKKALGNTYFDTAASPYLYRNDIFATVVQVVGEDKVLFGSDFPLIKQRRIVNDVESLNLPNQTKRAILAENARTILGL